MIAPWLAAGALLALALVATGTAAAAPPKQFFGVDPQTALGDQDYLRMGEAGVGVLRFQLSWPATGPDSANDDYDWSSADAVVGEAAANGVRALPFVLGAPDLVLGFDAPAWRAFLTAAVGRYGPGGDFWTSNPELPRLPIRDWQIWNEQNSPTNWEPRPNVRAYAALLEVAHEAIKSRDPGATVIIGGMFGTPFGGLPPGISAWDFLARLYRIPGARRSFEGVALHPYAAALTGVKRQVDRVRRRMAAAGDKRARLWVTELGWASGGAPHPLNRGLAGQAKRLRQSFGYLIRMRRKLRIANLTWYSWRDASVTDAGLCAWCPQSGLLTADGDAKPAFDAFTEFTGGR